VDVPAPGFITSVGAWNISKSYVYQGAATANGTNEWLVPANSWIDVILLSNGSTFRTGLWDSGTPTDYSFSAGGFTYNLSGDSGFDYGRNAEEIEVYRFARYLKTASVMTTDVNANVALFRSRFQATSTLQDTQPLVAPRAFTFNYLSPSETPLP